MNSSFSIKEITQSDLLEPMRKPWDFLAAQHGSYFPYLCFDWFKLWLEHFLGKDRLFILQLIDSGEVVAIAPFLIREERFKGVPSKKIELIGNVYSPVRNFLLIKTKRDSKVNFLIHFFNHLKSSDIKWDIIDLYGIPEEEGSYSNIGDAICNSRLNFSKYFCFANWYHDSIYYESKIYFSSMSHNARKNLRAYGNRAQKAGKLLFKMIVDYDSVEHYMEVYFDVYKRSWKKQERLGPDFYLALAKHAAIRGWLRLGIIFLDDVAVAAGFAFIHNGNAYFEKMAYDEKYGDLGIGTVWLTKMIEHVVDIDKVSLIDFMRGDEEYKHHWVKNRRERFGYYIFNRTIKGRFLYIMNRNILPLLNNNKYLSCLKNFVKNTFRG